MTLQEIIQLYDDSWNRETDEVKKPHFEIPEYLSYIFSFLTKNIANDCLEPEMSEIHRRIDELEKILKTHRHDVSKSYSEKPAW